MERSKNFFERYQTHLLIMLCTYLVIRFIDGGVGNEQFVSKVEFGATLSSIILSVVAIVYTLIQSKQSETVNAKIVDASEMIKEHSGTLKNSAKQMEEEVNSLKEMNLEKTLREHMEKFDEKLDSIEEIMTGGFNEVTCTLNNADRLFDGKYRVITEKEKEFALNCISSIFENIQELTYAKVYLYILLKLYACNSEDITILQIKKCLVEMSDGINRIVPKVVFNANNIQKIIGMHGMNVLIGLVSSDGKLNIDREKLVDIMSKFKGRINNDLINELDIYVESRLNELL